MPNTSKFSRRTLLTGSTALTVSNIIWGGGVSLLGSASPSFASDIWKYTLEAQLLEDDKMGYNGKRPGPVLEAVAGDWIDVEVINSFPVNPPDEDCTHDHNQFHGKYTTNLHTHGLHVSPVQDSSKTYDADNVFLKITPPGQVNSCKSEDFRDTKAYYRFELPPHHPAGTFWYHAHKHGSTFDQVKAGLAGPLIIRDKPGDMPAYIEQANERIFMLMDDGAVLVAPEGGGQLNPKISLKRGSVERWRIINANPSGENFITLNLKSDEIELWQIAFDGLTLDSRVKVDPFNDADPWENHAALAPGNRTDLMVYVPKDAAVGELTLAAVKADKSVTHSDGNLLLSSVPVEISIEIEEGEAGDLWSDDDELPGSGLVEFDSTPEKKRTTIFGNGGLVIDGKPYSGKVEKEMILDTAEEWIVENASGGTHPFHIHVNPFFVTHINGVELATDSPLRRWQDTLALPPKNADGTNGSVNFSTRFENFRGAFVIHCHILFHEDRGMMQKVAVI